MSLKAFDVRLPEAYRSTDFKVFEGLGKIALGIWAMLIGFVNRKDERAGEYLLGNQ